MARTRSDWENLVEEHAQSGMSAAEFCKLKRIHSSSLSKYKKIFSPGSTKRKPPISKDIPRTLVDVTPNLAGSIHKSPTLVLSNDSGLKIEVFL